MANKYYADPGIRTTQRAAATTIPDAVLNVAMTMDELQPKGSWPPASQKARLARYAQNKLLFAGYHDKVYDQWASTITENPDTQRALVYIAVNLPGAITRLVADLLYGEQGEGFHATVKNVKTQEALARIIEDNGFLRVAYETGGLGASYRGDGVFKVYLRDGKARIVPQPASNWFPVVNPGNVKEIVQHILAWPVKLPGDRRYLRKEIHSPGQIINLAYKLDGGSIGPAVKLTEAGAPADLKEIEPTQIDRPLVVHIPNMALDDELFGLDDYMDLDTLFPVYNTLLSRNDLILMKHSDPNMYAPESCFEYNEQGVPILRTAGRAFPIPSDVTNAQAVLGYMTWDGQLEAAFKQLGLLAEAIYLVSETSPAAFGLESEGGVAESGRALRFRLMRTLAKVNRKRLYADPAVKDVLEIAMKLEEAHGGGYSAERPSIEWQDGLPADPLEEAQIAQARGVDRSMRLVDAIMFLDKVDEATAKARAKEILEEIEAAMPSWGRSPFGDVDLNDRRGRGQEGGGNEGSEGGSQGGE